MIFVFHGVFSCRLRRFLLFIFEPELLSISIITKLEQLRELEIALVVHKGLLLGKDHCDKDQCIKNEHQAINIEPELHLFLVINDSQAVYVYGYGR